MRFEAANNKLIEASPAPNALEIITQYSFRISQNFSPIILLRLIYYSKIILRRYTRNKKYFFKN